MQRLVLWLVIAALLATVWWLASERNEHHFHVAAQGGALVIERGRFFPTGTAPVAAGDRVYGPVAIPAGEKPPAEAEFDDQTALDRWLFDLLSSWAKDAGKKGEGKAAASLVDRASALPGLTGAQLADLGRLRADLAWDDAQADLANAQQLVEAARRKLEAVKQGNGAHAADAAALSGKLEGVQNTLHDLGKKP
ncbi:MAG TPA: hypothetical protein VMK66_13290 [Myxococcales bacterium]|nr:hypothetical protein [Myxococcales bacterium]